MSRTCELAVVCVDSPNNEMSVKASRCDSQRASVSGKVADRRVVNDPGGIDGMNAISRNRVESMDKLVSECCLVRNDAKALTS
jgi:hypothetical protein